MFEKTASFSQEKYPFRNNISSEMAIPLTPQLFEVKTPT